MKPILNKEMVLEFARKAKDKTDNMPKDSVTYMAINVGRLEVIGELMDLILETI